MSHGKRRRLLQRARPVLAPSELLDDDTPDHPKKVTTMSDATGAEISPDFILQALLAEDLTAFTEFAFGVVRPGITIKPNWHFEAVTQS